MVASLSLLLAMRTHLLARTQMEKIVAERLFRCTVAPFEAEPTVSAAELVASCEAAVEAYDLPQGAHHFAFRVGRLAHRVGDDVAAERMLHRALELGAPDAMRHDVELRLALLALQRGDPDARRQAQEAVERCEASGEARCRYALGVVQDTLDAQ